MSLSAGKQAERLSTLHLYRHLLREATYLPPIARQHIEPRIRQRFHSHHHDREPEKRLKRGQHGLRYLRAANMGDYLRMRRVLMTALGRIGWRYHRLLEDLRRPEQPDSAAALAEQLEDRGSGRDGTAGRPPDWLDNWNTEKLLAFARSQAQQPIVHSPRPDVVLKQLHPESAVPPENAWGRPFAPHVQRTKLRKWWIALVHRLLPPLPRGEWELLGQLARGEADPAWSTVPPRRPKAAVSPSDGPAEAAAPRWEWEKYASLPIRVADRKHARRWRVLFETDENRRAPGPFDGPPIGVIRHRPRSWRRMYGDLFQMCATMERISPPKNDEARNEARDQWKITWGTKPPRAPRAKPRQPNLLRGVDRKGRPVAEPQDKEEGVPKWLQKLLSRQVTK